MSRKILFRHGRAPGDVLMFTAGIRDFKAIFPDIAINASCQFSELFANNPYIDRSIKKGDSGVEYYEVGYPTIQACNDGYIHFSMSFLLDMISNADSFKSLPISVGEFCSTFCCGGDKDWREGEKAKEPFITWGKKHKGITKIAFRQFGDLHLSESEKQFNPIAEHYAIDRYWVIAPGGKRDCTAKIWDWRRFQKVIDHFDGLIKFVTMGRSDHLIERLRGVIDFTDKTKNIRELVPLVYHSEGCVSGVSLLMHLAAAVPPKSKKRRKPCVAIYGGREPTSFTWYTNHQILHTNGAFSCCDNGGCWQSRIVPIAKDADKNKRMCHNSIVCENRTIQQCMDTITHEDVIRAIEKYYEGNLYHCAQKTKNTRRNIYQKKMAVRIKTQSPTPSPTQNKEINILASLQSEGGGEQSACKIADVFRKAGWKAHLYAWAKTHPNYAKAGVEARSFKGGAVQDMKPGIPLLFYGNDQINEFCNKEIAGELVAKSSGVIIGINYVNGRLPRTAWLTDKLRAVIFQNTEKLEEFRKDAIGFEHTKLISLFGAIDLDRFYELPQARREDKQELVILKHCCPDFRKYVTTESEGNGPKIHQWQQNSIKENDMKFYGRLLKDCKFPIRFEFMEAHKEIVDHFANDRRMTFHKWDAMDVGDFLKRGHIYLYRSSNMWRDQYPRCVAEALAAGMPVLTEPRDGTRDRVVFGDTGFHCMDYDQFLEAIKKLQRKETYRFNLGRNAKEWAKRNLDPREWVDVIEEIIK